MLKLAKKYEDRLDCICGLCQHDCMDSNCLFNKIINDMHSDEAQKRAIIKLMDDVIKDVVNVVNKIDSKPKKTTRGKISSKKGK